MQGAINRTGFRIRPKLNVAQDRNRQLSEPPEVEGVAYTPETTFILLFHQQIGKPEGKLREEE